jgi:type VI secretion system protein ImpM
MAHGHLGFFGKLPNHGDFVDRGLARAFINLWDPWLQAVIANSRQLLGADWLGCYLTAPIWRFVLTPGVCGPEGWQGLMMPSVDRVNRHFPLTFAMPRDPGGSALADLLERAAWFDRCEEVALSALDTGVDADALFGRLLEIPPVALPRVETPCPARPAGDPLAWQFALPKQPATSALTCSVAESLLRRTGSPFSLWWSEGSPTIDRCLLIHQGLPTTRDFAALLDGRWDHWDWDSCPVPAPVEPTPAGPAAAVADFDETGARGARP